MWLLGLWSLALIGGAIYAGHRWYERSWQWDERFQQSVFSPDFGWNPPTALLCLAVLLGLIAVAGGPLLKLLLRMTKPGGDDPRKQMLSPDTEQRLRRPDGSELLVKTYGRTEAPPLLLTHGWGLNSDEWVYTHRELANHFRLIVWDEAGLGASKQPTNRDFSLEKMATDLESVLALAGGGPAVLVGHSIGGMIILTFCRLYPETLAAGVSGLVLTHTTYTNPIRTTSHAAFLSAIEKPVLVPLMYLTIALSPLVWLMNWLSYRNGSAHLSNMKSSFAGTETWEQIDFSARFTARARPLVLARGMLGMMKYDATAVLKTITLPTLVVAGNKDTTCKPEASARMRDEIPGARLVTLAPARHLGLIEHHTQYAQAIHDFARPLEQVKTFPSAPAGSVR